MAMYKTGTTPATSRPWWFVDGHFFKEQPELEKLPYGTIVFVEVSFLVPLIVVLCQLILQRPCYQMMQASSSSPINSCTVQATIRQSDQFRRLPSLHIRPCTVWREEILCTKYAHLVFKDTYLTSQDSHFLATSRTVRQRSSVRRFYRYWERHRVEFANLISKWTWCVGLWSINVSGINGRDVCCSTNGPVRRLALWMDIKVLGDNRTTELTDWIIEKAIFILRLIGKADQRLSWINIRNHLYFATALGNHHLFVSCKKNGIVVRLPVV